MYVRESLAAHMIPVFTYYQMLQSEPAAGVDEQQKDLSNLRNAATMRAYWADYSAAARDGSAQSAGSRLVVVHVEPDLWGYLEQAHAVRPGPLVRAAPDRAPQPAGAARPARVAPQHLGHRGGPRRTRSPRSPTWTSWRRCPRRSTSRCTPTSTSCSTTSPTATPRFYQDVEGNPDTWWGPADFERHDRYIAGFTRRTRTAVVLWQLPLGDTHENNTWDHYQDNRLQWWLGPNSAAHLRATRNSGVIGLLFGAGASGNTTDQTDGGFFYRLARRYMARPLSLSRPLAPSARYLIPGAPLPSQNDAN